MITLREPKKAKKTDVGVPKRSSGEPGEPERSEGTPRESAEQPTPTLPAGLPDPEVPEKPRRRRYAAEYKLRVLKEVDACRAPGELGALLRREGLYFSHIKTWRRQRDEGALSGLAPRKRGPKPRETNPLARRVAELERDKRKLEKRLEEARIIIEFQKKIAEVLGIPLKKPDSDEEES
jgi:transposase-like protein